MARRKRAKQDKGGGTATLEQPKAEANGKHPKPPSPETDAALDAANDRLQKDNPELAAKIGLAVDEQAIERQRKAEAFDRIAAINKGVDAAFTEWHSVNERAKSLKKTWEAKVAELQGAIYKAANPPPMPLFDKAPGTNGTPVNGAPKPDEAWRTVKLEEAMPDVSEALLAKLYAANIHTVGELAAWTAEDGGRHQITDIDGIGPKMAEKIEEGLTGFWARYKAPPAPETVTEPEEAAEADGAEEGGEGDDEAEASE